MMSQALQMCEESVRCHHSVDNLRQRKIIRLLLLWTSLLALGLVASLVHRFIPLHHTTEDDPECKLKTFKPQSGSLNKIQWQTSDKCRNDFVAVHEMRLLIKEDAKYCLVLQVTLQSQKHTARVKRNHTVMVKVEERLIRKIHINDKGFLHEVEDLNAGQYLHVSFSSAPDLQINTTDTYLSIHQLQHI